MEPELEIEKLTKKFMYRELSQRVRELIVKNNLYGKFLAPEPELAKSFGVSRTTVRKGLDELQKEGIITRMHGKGIRVREKKSSLSERAAGRIAVGMLAGCNPDFVRGIVEVAGEYKWLSSFSNLIIPSVRADFISLLKSGAADAVIFISVIERGTLEDVLSIVKGPVALLDHHFPGLPVISVMEDGASGIRKGVKHLIRQGHRRIGLVEHTRRELNPWKYQGYAEALAAAGLPMDGRLVVQAAPEFESGQRAAGQLLALADPPTGIVAVSDHVALGVWRAVEASGRKVGRDVALVGYGDTAIRAGVGTELSSIRFDAVEMGRVAMRKVVACAKGRGTKESVELIPTELVVRQSSGGMIAGVTGMRRK